LNRKILISFLLAVLILTAVGCAQASSLPDAQSGNTEVAGNVPVVENPATPETENSQAPEEESPKILKIGDILGNPEGYWGQSIIVAGKIVSECPAGCWFTLNDNTGTIYVDLAPSNLVIPQKRGAFATVYGKVVRKGSDAYIIGTKVEF
jgi:hypothetical protein